MENYLPLLQKSPLFASMEPQQITSVLHCVGAVVREAGAGEYILRAGDRTQAMGLLLSGSAFAVQDDLWGQRNIMGKILPPGTFAEPFAATPGAVLNLVSVLARKNLQLNDKITHMSKRRTREKLLSYLSSESLRQGSLEFDIPFDRQQLADYLCIERSAMSAELSRLQKDGLLATERSHFRLIAPFSPDVSGS